MISLRFFLIAVAVAYFVAGALLYFFQDRFLYFPTPEIQRDDAEAIYLEQGNIQIKVWKVASGNDKAIIYFGGNAENVANNIPNFKEALPAYDLYLMNYRGYGGSGGKPREADLYADALAVNELVSQDFDDISIVGRSLGSGIATYVAANRDVKKLALITPYDSIERIAQKKFPMFPAAVLMKDKYDSASRAPKITAETLVIVAENDGVITRGHSDRLISAFSATDVNVVIVENSNHLSVSSYPEFWAAFEQFFQSASD